ncbi:MAG: DUF3987 domain-containing protein [Bacteroides sp.]|nr:DUF3987 domain-containing protein [Bacteroides sp.]
MKELQISVFRSVASGQLVNVSVEQVVSGIRGGRWQQAVEQIRQAQARGDKQAVADGKRLLPFVAFSGVFEGGHRASQLRVYSALVVLDYDKIADPARLVEMRSRCAEHPSVVSAFVTPSGEGLKVVVRTAGSAERHGHTYRQVAALFDRLLGCASDPACKDISRGHFVSWDPETFYRADACPLDLPEAVSEGAGAVQELPAIASISGESLGAADLSGQAACRSECPAAGTEAPPVGIAPCCSTNEWVAAWQTLYPAVEGQRNNLLFRMACEAAGRGIPQQELYRAAVARLAQPGFDSREIAAVVKSAYSRATREEASDAPSLCHGNAKMPLVAQQQTDGGEEERLWDEKIGGESLREHTPTFPERVFEALPALLREAMVYTKEPRERDVLLLGLLTAVSACLPQVQGFYHYKAYWPNLYTFVVAAAASNKSVLEYAYSLFQVYVEQAMRRNQELRRQYEADLEAYQKAERQAARRQGSSASPDPQRVTPGPAAVAPPEEPRYFFPHIPGDTSKARILHHVRENGDRGGLLFETEADTLSGAGRQEYGNFFDYLRKFFQHESTSSSFKVNGEPIYLHRPRLAVLLSGTPSQLNRLIPTSENGLYSRFLFYTFRQAPRWKSVVPLGEEEDEVEKHFQALSHRLAQAYAWLEKHPTRVRLSHRQWVRMDEVFSDLLRQSSLLEREDFQSCVKRHGLMTMRLCMVFTALEKAEQGYTSAVCYCSQSHFEAALSIATTCLEHSRLLITSVQAGDGEVRELENPDKLSLILERLPRQFTTRQFMDTAVHLEIPKRTAYRLLKSAIGLKINKISHGLYEICA